MTDTWTTFDDTQFTRLLTDPQLRHSARVLITATGHSCRPATVQIVRENAKRVYRQRYREWCGLTADGPLTDEDGAPLDHGFVYDHAESGDFDMDGIVADHNERLKDALDRGVMWLFYALAAVVTFPLVRIALRRWWG